MNMKYKKEAMIAQEANMIAGEAVQAVEERRRKTTEGGRAGRWLWAKEGKAAQKTAVPCGVVSQSLSRNCVDVFFNPAPLGSLLRVPVVVLY